MEKTVLFSKLIIAKEGKFLNVCIFDKILLPSENRWLKYILNPDLRLNLCRL